MHDQQELTLDLLKHFINLCFPPERSVIKLAFEEKVIMMIPQDREESLKDRGRC